MDGQGFCNPSYASGCHGFLFPAILLEIGGQPISARPVQRFLRPQEAGLARPLMLAGTSLNSDRISWPAGKLVTSEERNCPRKAFLTRKTVCQGRNFPEWILVKKLPWKPWFLPACFPKENGPKKSTEKSTAETKHQNPPKISGKGCPWRFEECEKKIRKTWPNNFKPLSGRLYIYMYIYVYIYIYIWH